MSLCFQRTYEELKHMWCSRGKSIWFWFSAYLWGIETIETKNKPPPEGGVFSVPMRNWNPTCYPRKSFPFLRFQRTYEELKLARFCLIQASPANVFSVPMRNWNLPLLLLFPQPPSQFSAYLWGIETLLSRPNLLEGKGFQRTYEELKLGMGSCRTSIIRVFSVPMRNWNTVTQEGVFLCPGFQRTYEELKLNFFRIFSANPQTVFSVPMRNWNLRTKHLVLNPKDRFQRTYEELKRSYAEYLGGLWYGFQRTYEELKLWFLISIICKTMSF